MTIFNLAGVWRYLFRTTNELGEQDANRAVRWLTVDGICVMSMMTLQVHLCVSITTIRKRR